VYLQRRGFSSVQCEGLEGTLTCFHDLQSTVFSTHHTHLHPTTPSAHTTYYTHHTHTHTHHTHIHPHTQQHHIHPHPPTSTPCTYHTHPYTHTLTPPHVPHRMRLFFRKLQKRPVSGYSKVGPPPLLLLPPSLPLGVDQKEEQGAHPLNRPQQEVPQQLPRAWGRARATPLVSLLWGCEELCGEYPELCSEYPELCGELS